MNSILRKAGRIMWIVLSILVAFILILVAVLEIWSIPGKPQPFVAADGKPLAGSLSEKVFVDINGVRQGMFIKSRNTANPVLLYLHGGMPDYFLSRQYPTGLDHYFTMVWWEQRGAGLSYDPHAAPGLVTLEQAISDTLAVTNYVRQRFGKDKIYLMGHSGGTFIAIQTAARQPELYYAYIGVAQVSNQLKSEKEAYDYILAKSKANGNMDMVRRLEAAPVTIEGGTPQGWLQVRDAGMHSLGIGTMHNMDSVLTGIILPSVQNPDYTLPEKVSMWRAKAASGVSPLWHDAITTDLSQTLPEFNLPVYFLQGIYDGTCSYTEARAYFEKLKAPVRGFYTFENSAHSPIFEEPGKVQQIMQVDVLQGTNTLADIN